MKYQKILGLAGLLSIAVCASFSFSIPSFAFKEVDPSKLVNTKIETLQENDINRFTNAIAQIKDFYVQPVSVKQVSYACPGNLLFSCVLHAYNAVKFFTILSGA